MKILKGNIVKCNKCKSILQYVDQDIKEIEKEYCVSSYAGETYMANIIVCPKCNYEIEVYR